MNSATAKQIALDTVLPPQWRKEIAEGFRCPRHPTVVFSVFGTTTQTCTKCDDEDGVFADLPPELVFPMDLITTT